MDKHSSLTHAQTKNIFVTRKITIGIIYAYFYDTVKYQPKQDKIVSQMILYDNIDHKFSNSKFTMNNRITKYL